VNELGGRSRATRSSGGKGWRSGRAQRTCRSSNRSSNRCRRRCHDIARSNSIAKKRQSAKEMQAGPSHPLLAILASRRSWR
jgi:hypothetical protein